ncbi:MAG: response regulator transcription factor [Saprospiraceae bacterium]|nr:response regulator transcription factor [Saprospiraceae bacterium]
MYKILYVEDEAFLAKIVSESLERLGHEVVHLPDGRNVEKKFMDYQPDICVFDIMLPVKNGYELAKEIRSVNPHTPILFLTAKSQTQDVVEGFQAGGNDYIKKPFSMEELQVRIQNLMHLTTGTPSKKENKDVIQIGKSFTFHPIKLQLKSLHFTKTLSHKESQILQLLCENINSTIERKKILLKVWNDDSYFNSRNLDVYIRKLRTYFSEDESIQILTLKGVGYHFAIDS